MPRRFPVLALLALVPVQLGSCYAVEQADLVRYSHSQGFPITTAAPPPGSELLGIVHAEETGFYLLGLVPIWDATLQGCLDRLLAAARARGADAVGDLRYEVKLAQFFKFTAFSLPDWSARVVATGTAYRRPEAPGEHPTQVPPGVRTAPVPAGR